MNGYQKGAITGGIGEGINKAVANIRNLYGLQQRFDLQQQGLAIDKQNADTKQKRMHYNLASRFARDFDPTHWLAPSGPGTREPLGGVDPRASHMGLDASLDVDPRYLQPSADALRD